MIGSVAIPTPLKGEYKITIMLDGADLEMEEGQITIWEGEEEDDNDTLGFTSTILLLTVVITVAIYKKKERLITTKRDKKHFLLFSIGHPISYQHQNTF
ncbi:MAG: hypothetical protein ACOC8Y_04810 [Candidatus Natronoplasma sp.]